MLWEGPLLRISVCGAGGVGEPENNSRKEYKPCFGEVALSVHPAVQQRGGTLQRSTCTGRCAYTHMYVHTHIYMSFNIYIHIYMYMEARLESFGRGGRQQC